MVQSTVYIKSFETKFLFLRIFFLILRLNSQFDKLGLCDLNYLLKGVDGITNDWFVGQLDREYEADDDVEVEDLPFYDERKPKQGMDTSKLDGRDHVTTWSQSKKGQQFGLYVNTVEGNLVIYNI